VLSPLKTALEQKAAGIIEVSWKEGTIKVIHPKKAIEEIVNIIEEMGYDVSG